MQCHLILRIIEGLQKTVISIWMRNQAQGSCLCWPVDPARQQEPGPGQQIRVNLGLLAPQTPACGTTYCSASKSQGLEVDCQGTDLGFAMYCVTLGGLLKLPESWFPRL